MKKSEFDWELCRDWVAANAAYVGYCGEDRRRKGYQPIYVKLQGESGLVGFGRISSEWSRGDWLDAVEATANDLGIDPPWESEEHWSEPISQMDADRCAFIAASIGGSIETVRHQGVLAPEECLRWHGFYTGPELLIRCESLCGWSTRHRAAREALIKLAHAMGRMDDAGRVRLSD